MRFPLDPLVPLIERKWQPNPHTSHITIIGKTATVLGVARNTAARWLEYGVNHAQADRVACLLDVHPLELWPDWLAVDDTICDRPGHGAIKRHRAAGEPLCLDCATFYNAYQADYRKRMGRNKGIHLARELARPKHCQHPHKSRARAYRLGCRCVQCRTWNKWARRRERGNQLRDAA